MEIELVKAFLMAGEPLSKQTASDPLLIVFGTTHVKQDRFGRPCKEYL